VSQRTSGYRRLTNDSYTTPAWVTEALVPYLPRIRCALWEPASGSGAIVAALRAAGFGVVTTDVTTGHDFLTQPAPRPFRGVVTNPPYGLATEFIERALGVMPFDGFVAMLLRTDFDHAPSRRHLFAACPLFAKKLVLTRRIRWFADSVGSPSFNHCWFIWDRKHRGPPTLAYGP
jgi:methylase of polypeptide subunit release factors